MGGVNTPDAIFLNKYIGAFGLVLFTFSSGFKFGHNHFHEMENKEFIKKYYLKRFIRLYKPYIGYSILTSIPLFFVTYIAVYCLDLKFSGLNIFWENLDMNKIYHFIVGNNFIAGHLWYLVALIAITAACFSIVYYTGVRALKILLFILILFDIYMWETLLGYSELLFKIMIYMPTYIFGIFYSGKKIYLSQKYSLIFSTLFIIIFLVSIIQPSSHIFKYRTLLYGFTLPPTTYLFSEVFLNNNKTWILLSPCSKYSFQIYLLHEPLILPILERGIIDILGINYFIMPYIVTIIAIVACILVYKFLRSTRINIIFE